MDYNWDVWAWRRKKDVCPFSGCELMGTVNLCLAVTFRGGNELPTAAATAKNHNRPIRRATAVTAIPGIWLWLCFQLVEGVGEVRQQHCHRSYNQQVLSRIWDGVNMHVVAVR